MNKKYTYPVHPVVLVLVTVFLTVFGVIFYQNSILKQYYTAQYGDNEAVDKSGINREKIQIYYLDLDDINWQYASQAYTLKSAYLMEDVADFGMARENESIKGKQFLALEIDIRNRSIEETNSRSQMLVSKHVRVRTPEGDSSPVAGEFIYLSGQENGSIYTVFAVDPDSKDFTLLVGDLAAPRVLKLDFESESVEEKSGVFLLKEGFKMEYPSE